MPDTPKEPMKSKLVFCWLALLTGVIGGHWIYAGQKRFLAYLVFPPLGAFMGWADAIRYGLMNDTQFNQRLNPDYPADTPQTNGLVVTAVALSLGVSVTALMSLLALLFQWMLSGTVA